MKNQPILESIQCDGIPLNHAEIYRIDGQRYSCRRLWPFQMMIVNCKSDNVPDGFDGEGFKGRN